MVVPRASTSTRCSSGLLLSPALQPCLTCGTMQVIVELDDMTKRFPFQVSWCHCPAPAQQQPLLS